MAAHLAVAPIDVDDSIEALLGNHPTATRTVYLLVLAIVLIAAGAAALTSVDVTVRAPATLRPLVERQTIRAALDGTVERVLIARGDVVHAGDTLVRFVSTATDVARAATDATLREQRDLVHDLHLLIESDPTLSQPKLRAPRLEAAWRGATLQWRQASARVQQAELVRDRLQKLAERGFAVPAELETAQFDLAHAREERALLQEQRRTGWAEELAAARQRVVELERDRARESTERATHAVIAPVAGTVEELAPVAPGSVVRAGDAMATISPNAELVADMLVEPRDVARIRAGMPVRLLVEGYDVQEWGAAEGVVTSVATDYTVVANEPVFRVTVRPLGTELRRPDGRTVWLKKGLRCQARFILGRRRLTALLMRRGADWIDPSAPGAR